MTSEEICFDRDEFGKPDFSAGDFVRKWQASVTLDILQDSLRAYMKELKDRLYELINRDYADFVKISSKLSGVDETVEVLALPLRNVKDEVGALHVAVEEMRVDMQEAMAAVSRSRKCSELLQRCITAVEAASLCQHLLDLSDDDGVGIGSQGGLQKPKEAQAMQHAADQRWEHGKGILDDAAALHIVRLKTTAKATEAEHSSTVAIYASPAVPTERHTRVQVSRLNYRFMRRCFTLERAGHLCRELVQSLRIIDKVAQELKGGEGGGEDRKLKLSRVNSTELDADPELGAISLASEVLETMQPLCHNMERECTTQTSSLFSAAVNPTPIPVLRPTIISDKDRGKVSDPVEELDVADEMLSTGVQAIIRTAALMEKASALEQLFQRLVMKRAIEELLTPGQLDASGGRGLCKGLPKILYSLYVFIVKAALPVVALSEVACAYDEGRQNGPTVAKPDLFLKGIMTPIFGHFLGGLSAIFAPGRADVLQANYTCIHRFLKNVCAATEKVVRMHSAGEPSNGPSKRTALTLEKRVLQCDAYLALEAKWSLPVYFQLRVSDLTQFLESFLTVCNHKGLQSDIGELATAAVAAEGGGSGQRAVGGSTQKDPAQKMADTLLEAHRDRLPAMVESPQRTTDGQSPVLHSPASRAFCMSLLYVWQDNILLAPLVSQALSLTLSLVSRFAEWVRKTFEVFDDDDGEKRAAETALRSPEEAMMLKADVQCLVKWGRDVYVQYASSRALNMLEEGLGVQSDDEQTRQVSSTVSSAVLDAWETLSEANAKDFDVVVSAIAKRCSEVLTGVRGISAAYRFTNKPAPTAPSVYVANILRPLTAFERDWIGDGSASRSPAAETDKLSSFRVKVAALILERLEADVKALMQSVKQMEDALQRRRQPNASKGNRLSDGDKIILQVRLDVDSLKENLEAMGLDLSTIPSWESISELLAARG
uniref:Conserved oligomeric Golgi complex subunit 2 n=1 Tax=Pinguiococcus pyrenoidosus TaxID=172671 RepID=A0A7R9U9Z0_9STRA|mmetsp:Transcript_2558/g.10692  ORF Transcript_2558/g.10692 Transcript_2558/m.10692 type:complete len:943 (+) Transcript_2558:327-3155(+)